MLGRDDVLHHAADRRFDVDGGVLPGLGDAPRQHDVAVEDGARRIGDRILLIVAFGEHGVERGDRAASVCAVAGAFDQRRQAREHRRRIALGGRRFADREADLALRLRETRQRIHDQQHVVAAVAEIFGDRGRQPRAVQAHQRRVVGRRRHHHGAAAPFRPEDALDEFLHFAAALADQPDDDDVGAGVARHHAEQHGLADAGAGEQADALAAADRQQRIDRAHADVERLLDRLARQRIDRTAEQASTRSSPRSGPRPSSGAPVPSMMRPSSPGPTFTLPARWRGMTRAFGARPCTSPVGMR